MSEIIIDKNAKQITFTNNGIAFSQFGIANEILDLIENQEKEIERLNNAFDCLEQVIRYYVIDNVKYDNNTAEYILNRMLTFWGKDSDKE